jgi:3-phytase
MTTDMQTEYEPEGQRAAAAGPPESGGRRRRYRRIGVRSVLSALAVGALGCQDPGPQVSADMGPTTGMLTSTVGTSPPLPNNPLDAAIWMNSADPNKSLVFASDRTQAMGRLYSYDLSGQNLQSSNLLMQPGLVDVKTGFVLGGQTLDLVAVAEAGAALIRIYSIDRASGQLTDITGFTDVFKDRTGDSAVPVGVALYRRASDNLGFVVVSPRSGPMTDYLYQYRLDYVAGKINLTYARRFGEFSTITTPGDADVKGILVDDAAGYLYYTDKSFGIRKYLADPDAPNANTELTVFGQSEFAGDRNGLALYEKADGSGYLLSVDQTASQSRVLLWSRAGVPGNPNSQPLVATLSLNADFIDGIAVTSAPLGSRYGSGLLVVSNRSGKNFLYYNWQEIVSALRLR